MFKKIKNTYTQKQISIEHMGNRAKKGTDKILP